MAATKESQLAIASPDSEPQGEPASPNHVLWQVMLTTATERRSAMWMDLGEQEKNILEKAWLLGTWGAVTWWTETEPKKPTHVVDFRSMTQMNLKTQTCRAVRRLDDVGPKPFADVLEGKGTGQGEAKKRKTAGN